MQPSIQPVKFALITVSRLAADACDVAIDARADAASLVEFAESEPLLH